MSTVTKVMREEQEQEKRLAEAKAKVLDFSEAYEALEKAEAILSEMIKRNPHNERTTQTKTNPCPSA